MENNFEKNLEHGELARERGDYQNVLETFDDLIIESLKEENVVEAINALGQHLLIYDRLYKKTGRAAFLEMMFMDAQTGMRLAEKNDIHGQPLALMKMRSAEYYLDTKDFAQAEKLYQEAFDELDSDPNATNEEKAEYLGHLAEAVIYSGDIDRADPLFKQASELLDNASEKLRNFHKLVIKSGMLMREANGLFINKEVDKAKTLLSTIEPIVLELKDIHDMDGRYSQFLELQSKFNS